MKLFLISVIFLFSLSGATFASEFKNANKTTSKNQLNMNNVFSKVTKQNVKMLAEVEMNETKGGSYCVIDYSNGTARLTCVPQTWEEMQNMLGGG